MSTLTTLTRIAAGLALTLGIIGTSSALAETTCTQSPEIWVWTTWLGPSTAAGTITVEDDATNLYVTYEVTYPGARLGRLLLAAGNERRDVADRPDSVPDPPQFSYSTNDDPRYVAGRTVYTVAIPLVVLGVTDVASACGLRLYVVTHAQVVTAPDRVDGAGAGRAGI